MIQEYNVIILESLTTELYKFYPRSAQIGRVLAIYEIVRDEM